MIHKAITGICSQVQIVTMSRRRGTMTVKVTLTSQGGHSSKENMSELDCSLSSRPVGSIVRRNISVRVGRLFPCHDRGHKDAETKVGSPWQNWDDHETCTYLFERVYSLRRHFSSFLLPPRALNHHHRLPALSIDSLSCLLHNLLTFLLQNGQCWWRASSLPSGKLFVHLLLVAPSLRPSHPTYSNRASQRPQYPH